MFRSVFIPMLLLLCGGYLPLHAAGTLTASQSGLQPIRITSHDVQVVINNGYARTEVAQTFQNPNTQECEAIYAFPLPKSASLCEVQITAGEVTIDGEVVAKQKATQTYEEEKKNGNQAGLATKEGFQRFEFRVARVPASGEVAIRFVYLQAVEIDSGVGRYLYPLEEGGTDEAAQQFWSGNDAVEGPLRIAVTIKSVYPIDAIRCPSHPDASIDSSNPSDEEHTILYEAAAGKLDKDFLCYYRLKDGLPGRVDMLTYRADENSPGTFMLVVTPGIDLQPLTQGADYLFVLDVSGSMRGKLHTLAAGVSKALGRLQSGDRFKIILFNDRARELVDWQAAEQGNVDKAIALVQNLQSNGGTDLYAGIQRALGDLDDDRVCSMILVTDGVTNTGVVSPKAFHQLLSTYDLRIFGFLLGNSANWPLMRTICETSGGYYTGVSNQDDIVGQIMLAKDKVTRECLHDADLAISGVHTSELSGNVIGKIYAGEQLLILGRYDGSGEATLRLKARLSGADKTYSSRFAFPAVDTRHPELERIWALARTEDIQAQERIGLVEPGEATDAVRDLGINYQIVTDETAMVVLSDEAFERHGIERRNKERLSRETRARQQRAATPVQQTRVDQQQPMFNNTPAHRPWRGGGGGGGGALPWPLAIPLAGLALMIGRRRKDEE